MLKIEVIGNIGADAVVQNGSGSKFVSFRCAHTDRWTDADGHEKEETRWVDCVWNNVDSKLVGYLKAGVKVWVRGHLRTRVYSSQKYRRMEAGVTCVVTEIELCGGSTDEVPRQVVDMSDGSIHNVTKHYWTDINTKKLKKDEVMTITDQRGKLYVIDKLGFVKPDISEQVSDTEQVQEEVKQDAQ